MTYSREFYALQTHFARTLAASFEMTIETALFKYTPMAFQFERHELANFSSGTEAEVVEIVWQCAQQKRSSEVLDNIQFRDHPLLGRFYFEVRESYIIRPHIAPVSANSHDIIGRLDVADKTKARFSIEKRAFILGLEHLKAL